MKRIHVLVRGRVQGVCYRISARDVALALELTGWVRNRPDGAVELVAEGTNQDLDHLVAWCRTGPPAARVDDVEVAPTTGSESLRGFEVG